MNKVHALPPLVSSREKVAVILLGAGYPFQGGLPTSLHETPDHRLVLDWIIDAYSGFEPAWHFVGGFQIDDIVQKYPYLNYSTNTNWQTTKVVESLFSAPLQANIDHFVSYTDIVYSNDVIAQLRNATGDIVLAVDTLWRERYENRSIDDLNIAEKVVLDGFHIMNMGRSIDCEKAHAEFAGIAKISARAVEMIMVLRTSVRSDFGDAGLLDLFTHLQSRGLKIQAVDIQGNWAELNAPQDLARYVLKTKSETLERLRPRVMKSQIGEQVSFRVGDWLSGQVSICEKIRRVFGTNLLAIRSSSQDEDSWDSANAGKFLSLINVKTTDKAAVVDAITQVIASYNSMAPDNQVLVQQMVLETVISGVVFTRTIRMGAPYYVINYDDKSGKTDTVTSGAGEDLKTLIIHRGMMELEKHYGQRFRQLIEAVRELETLVGHDALDIEFAITNDGTVHILQIRPIAIKHKILHVSDEQLDTLLQEAEEHFESLQSTPPQIVGTRNIFGIMPDWNPAEMIGTSPRQLALSLYKYLITDDTWAVQRSEFGYRDVRPQALMTTFLGHPYIDIRTCFNSFTPAGLENEFATALVDYYMTRLVENPHLHDKVEFDILFTSLVFDFEEQAKDLFKAGFSKQQISQLRDQLCVISNNAFKRYTIDYQALETLQKKYQSTIESTLSPLEKAKTLLDDCRRWGTLPFAHLARGAFIATSLLRSAVTTGLILESEHAGFMGSLVTVAGHLADDSETLAKGRLSQDDFLSSYGHLRPGTYEITNPCYADDPQQFLGRAGGHPGAECEQQEKFFWKPETSKKLMTGLHRLGLPDDIDVFDTFLRKTIEGREYGKFVFSKNLSTALDLIAEHGKEAGIDSEDISHISINEILTTNDLSVLVESGRRAYNISQAVELPPLICEAIDLKAFHYPENQPNFISISKVSAPIEDLTDGTKESLNLVGKIVVIPHADPGYDWIFSHQIAGLMTKLGGVNSHMAIRAAEFGLSAAIGLGELAYERYRRAEIVELDCAGRRIRIVK